MKIEKSFKMISFQKTENIFREINLDIKMISKYGEELSLQTNDSSFNKNILNSIMNDSFNKNDDYQIKISFEVPDERLI